MPIRIAAMLAIATAALIAAPKVEVHGHRGARMFLPENTLPGFEYAIQQGADYIEIDTWVTSDDVVVVAHDAAMNEKHCIGPAGAERTIRKMTYAEFRKWDCGVKHPDWPKQRAVPGTPPPSYEEILQLAQKYPKARINIEIKSNPQKLELQPTPDVYARMILDGIRKFKMEKRVLVQSFDFRPLRAMKAIAPELPLSALYPTGRDDKDRDFVDVAKDAGTATVSMNLGIVTKEKVAKAHAPKIRVLAWTANDPAEWQTLLDAGVDGLITDDPEGAVEFLKKKGLR